MKKYLVKIERIAFASYVVEANDESEAEDKAWEQYEPDYANECVSSEIYDVEELDDENK